MDEANLIIGSISGWISGLLLLYIAWHMHSKVKRRDLLWALLVGNGIVDWYGALLYTLAGLHIMSLPQYAHWIRFASPLIVGLPVSAIILLYIAAYGDLF